MRSLLFLFALSITLFSCQKELSFENLDGATSKYYLTCKIDGTDRDFSFSPTALTFGFAEQDSVLGMMGFSSATVDAQESITLNIYYPVIPPGAGTYTEDDTGTDYNITGIYDADSTNTLYTAGYASVSDYPLQIIITERTDTEISGTFEGAFYNTDIDDGEIHPEYLTITDGKFRLKLQR